MIIEDARGLGCLGDGAIQVVCAPQNSKMPCLDPSFVLPEGQLESLELWTILHLPL